MIKRFYILLLAIVASVGMSWAQDPGVVDTGTKGGMSYTFYDNGLLEISGSGALPGYAFTNWDGGFGTSVKNIRFAQDCEVYGLDYMWFACYTEKSQLETIEINSVNPIMFSGSSGAGINYNQDGAVTITITAPGIVDIENNIIRNYGSPVNMILNMPATTVFEKKWFSSLGNNFAVTIPTGAKGHIPAGYVFTDSYNQKEYDQLVADGHENMFWSLHSDLVEGVDYTLGVESTFVITAENASQIFGQAAVSFQAPTQASNSEWVLWRKSDLKTFSDMSSGDQKVYKDVTVKVNNGVYNTDSGFGIHFDSSDEDGVQFVAPEGKVFKRIVILNQYGTFSDPNWSYDGNYKKWSGSANTVGFEGDICGISLIEFEVGDAAPAPAPTPAELPGAFTINANGDKIVFSRGNLQAKTTDLGANWTWDFAPNQWSLIGNAVANNAINGNKTVSSNGTVDLFGWSTAATYYGIHNSWNNDDYTGDFVDWGALMGTEWRTLSRAEFRYIVFDRAQAFNKQGKATVNGVSGYIFLPDEWELPSGLSFTPSPGDYTTNQYDGANWEAMEAAGAVFLPAAGDRSGTDIYMYDYGWYWTSTSTVDDKAYYLYFYEKSRDFVEHNRYDAKSVRLVTAAPIPPYEAVMNLINAIGTVELTAECKAKIDAARTAYDALSDEDKAKVTNITTLTTAEAAYTALNQAEADKVIAKINNIPTTIELKLATRDSIESARAAYDALTDDQKLLVSNYDVLTTAEATWATLNPGGGMPADALNGKFTINAGGDQISFAKGNLQATTEDLGEHWTWGFAANQWNYLGIAVANNAISGNGTVSENGTVDLFGWSTAATYYGINNSYKAVDYSGDFVDWGSNMGAGWRTLTKDEWQYLIENNTKGRATVNDKSGYIFLPNDWSGPAFTPDPDNFTTNVYSGDDWTAMENAGAVFLPSGPARNGTYALIANDARYYSSTSLNNDSSYVFTIYYNQSQSACTGTNRAYGCMVRLVTAGGATPLDSALAVKDLIEAIPMPVTLEDACVKAIEDARAAYDALSDNAKGVLDAADVKKLTDAETALTALNQAEADKVVAKINNIPTPVELKLATRDSIQNARAAYDALNAAQQALVTNYQTLLDTEAALAAYAGGVPDGALAGKFTVNAAGDQIYFSKGNLQYTRESLDADWSTGTFKLAENQYDLIEENANPCCTDNYGDKTKVGLFGFGTWGEGKMPNLTTDMNSEYEWSTDFVGTLEGTNSWRTLNSQEWGYLLTHNDITLATVHGVEGLLVAPDGIDLASKSMNDYSDVVISDESWTSMEEAGVLFLPATGKRGKVYGGNVKTEMRGYSVIYWSSTEAYPGAAYGMLYQPNGGIQNPVYDTYVNSGIGVRLVTVGSNPLDQAQAVKDLIDAIPTPVEYPTSGPAIAAALVAYQQLSDDAKGALDYADVQKMTDAAAQYAALDAIAAIEAIPAEIVYDPLVKTAIETARDKFDALIDASKALVDAEVVAKLTNAEQAWAILVAKVEHNVSYIGKDGELKHETVALLHIPDPAPDFNGYEFVRWDVKAGDFLEEGLRIKAVYTPIITTNPVAYDSLMYNGTAQTLITAGVAKEGHIEYRINDGEWSAELPKATNAAAYVVYYKLVREGHEDYLADSIVAIIAKAPVTYTAPTAVDTLVYTASNQTLIAAGQTQDGTFEYSFNPTLLDSWNTELPQAMAAGTYNVYYRVQGDLNHLDSTAVDPIAVTIAKAELTATADDKSVIYGDLAPQYTVTYTGWQGTDEASVLTGEIAFACEYAKGSPVGEYVITPSGVTAANYDITFVNGKVIVNRKSAKSDDITAKQADNEMLVYTAAVNKPTIQAKDTTKTLIEGTDYTLSFVGRGETQYAESATAPIHVGNYTAIVAFVGNYKDTLTVDFAIAKAPLTITAENKEVIFGENAPVFTVAYTGFLGTDTATVLTGTQAYACEYVRGNDVGDYTIIPSGVDAHDYVITFVNGTLTVNRKSAKDADIVAAQLAGEKLIYTNAVNRPTIVVTDTTLQLTETKDYTLSFMGTQADNTQYAESATAPIHVGNYTAIVAFVGNYKDTLTVDFLINQAPLTITANDTAMIYGDDAPAFTVRYDGFLGTDDNAVLLGTQGYSCIYAPGSYIGTYAITPKDVTAYDYEITFVDGTLTVNKAHVYVSGAEAQIAKFADSHANAVVLEQGVLNGIKLNDPIAHVTTAAFSSADVAENLTITLFYELTGDAALLNNYHLDPTSDIFTTEGVIIEPFIPDDQPEEKEDEETTVEEGIEIYAYGYCDGSGYSLKYHLESGNPDQYKIDFADSRFTDVDWTNLVITGKDGTIDIDIPVDLPTGDYDMTVYFRDSRFDWLESRQFNVTFHVNLPETYVRPLFDNVIALVDTCNCLTDIQWYWRANSTDTWVAIPGANGYYYHSDTKLAGEYFVSVKMNGEPTYTCAQIDMETLYGNDNKQQNVQVKAYPNPVVTTTTVTIEGSENFDHNLRVVNLTGVEVLNTTFEGNETTVDMNGYVTGNYMISVDGITIKVLKQ